ncbi:MAG TPA: septal ring lytic transglycosylase RlpA family protein [Terriglobales bacterium]|nr:septal ring lytic transglycosylase RlpA family protein [Terriglobales bacterium]
MRRRLAESLAVLLSVASLGAGAASGPNSSEAARVTKPPVAKTTVSRQTKKQAKDSPYQVGTASWYGEFFQGKETASGEPYDMQALTAAHPTLPLGSFVRVTNLRNGRSVVVRINDRGPVVEGRIIDVSYNTARLLGFESRGLQRVRLDLVRPAAMARLQTVASLN